MYNFKEILGKNIKHLRENGNLSQDALSELLNISAKSVNYIENGRHFASPETLAALCKSLRCLPVELFKIEQITSSDNEMQIKENIYNALNSCNLHELSHIEKYIFTMVLDKNIPNGTKR